ncbi:MAG: hypothetical protein POG74_12020 [Acidocella sp.]|nr:hypothetical protein [Acidocella sp.]
MRQVLILASLLLLGACSSERHFGADSLWPFGNPNAPVANGETAQRALGNAPQVAPILPQAGNVWPGAVQPVPTIADEEKQMSQPLGAAFTPSLPSPYPPGEAPPENADLSGADFSAVPGASATKVKGQ